MSGGKTSVPTAHFDALYAGSPDPWRFETSDYEKRKYAATLTALPQPRYRSAFELGCSIGVLTGLLATRCDTILGGDCASAAIESARRKQAHHRNATFLEMRAPPAWPPGRFDLVVLSEVLYFLALDDMAAVAAFIEGSLDADGTIVLVNYLGDTDAALSGEDAANGFLRFAAGWTIATAQHRDPDFRLDVLRKRSAERTISPR